MAHKQYTIRLRTLTPLFIANGDVLSPYSDFIQQDNRLWIIDHEKMESLFADRPEALNEFVRSVKTKWSNNKSITNLRDFLKNRFLIADPSSISKTSRIIHGNIQNAQLKRFIHSAGRPFIPGSSVKGMIKSALLHHWLTKLPDGKAVIEGISKLVYINFDPRSSEYNEQRRRLLDYMSTKEAQRIRVSDSGFLDSRQLEVLKVARFKMQDLSFVSPQWSEVWPADVVTTFDLSIESDFSEPFKFLNDGIQSLFNVISHLSKSVLHHELDHLGEIKNKRHNQIMEQYEKFLKLTNSAGRCICRVGAYKTFLDQSIGLALYLNDPRIYDRWRTALGLGNPKTRNITKSRFPSTRSFLSDLTSAMGWVELSVE